MGSPRHRDSKVLELDANLADPTKNGLAFATILALRDQCVEDFSDVVQHP